MLRNVAGQVGEVSVRKHFLDSDLNSKFQGGYGKG